MPMCCTTWQTNSSERGGGIPTVDSRKFSELQTPDCPLSHEVKDLEDVTHPQP